MYPQNRFWSVLSELFQRDFNSVDSFQKREYLLERHIALYDVIESCTILGSKDSSITNVITSYSIHYTKLYENQYIIDIFHSEYDITELNAALEETLNDD